MNIKLTSSLLLEISIPDADEAKPARVYQLSVPSWASYDECKEVCNSFILGFDEMRIKNQEAMEKLKAAQEAANLDSQPKDEPIVVDSEPKGE